MAVIHWSEEEKTAALITVQSVIQSRGLRYQDIAVVNVPTLSGKSYFNAICIVADDKFHRDWDEVLQTAEKRGIPVMIGVQMYTSGAQCTVEVVN